MKKHFLLLCFFITCYALTAQQWNITLDHEGFGCWITEGCCTDNNETIFVGVWDTEAFVVKVDEHGNYTEKHFPVEDGSSKLWDIISIDDGRYFLVGVSKTNNNEYLWVLVIDDELNIVKEHFYEKEEGYSVSDSEFYNAKAVIDDDGTIVACVGVRMPFIYPETYRTRAVFMRFNMDCERLNSVFISPDAYGNLFYDTNFWLTSIMNAPNDDILVIGPGSGNCQSILRFDSDFNLIKYKHIIEPTLIWPADDAHSDYWIDNNNILLVSCFNDPDIHNKAMLVFGKTSLNDGMIYDNIWINKTDTLNYTVDNHSMCYANDTTIYLASCARLGSWTGPYALEIYLVTKNLEILGSKYFYDEIGYWPTTTIATKDDGIIAVSTSISERTYIKKLLREDFNPIPCSVSEVPKETIKALVYPNPAKDKLNIDISNLPQNTENRVSITDMQGITRMNRIIQGTGNLLTIDVSSLEPGAYVYSVYNREKEVFNGRFVKE